MVAVAVNVTLVPPHIVFPGFALIVTEGTTTGLTVMVIALEVAVAGEEHKLLCVITQVTT